MKRIDMTETIRQLEEVADWCEDLHGKFLYEEQGRKSPGSAAMRRELNRTADRLVFLSTRIRELYWLTQPRTPIAGQE